MANVLIACEHTQIVTEAFINAGHTVMSCDIEHNGEKGYTHYKGNVLDIINNNYDLVIGHPPCTRLTNSVWSYIIKHGLYHQVKEAADFFNKILFCNARFVCVENPQQNPEAKKYIFNPMQYIQPYNFGENASKKTGLWLRNLPPLINTVYCPPDYFIYGKPRWSNQTPGGHNKAGPGTRHNPKQRSIVRSRFFPGVAQAMAEQWTPVINAK
jgi:hypothetical protein